MKFSAERLTEEGVKDISQNSKIITKENKQKCVGIAKRIKEIKS